jgi:hypothetical protein
VIKGIYLTLLVGPAVPVPAPAEVLDALTSVEVHTSAEPRAQSGFSLTFTLDNRSPVTTLFVLAGGSIAPVIRVVLFVTFNGLPQGLIDGVVTRTSLSPGSDPGHSTLTVTGVDLTALMALVDANGVPFPAMPPEARIATILAKYAPLGVVPAIVPSFMIDVPVPTDKIPRQRGSDLNYINELADDTGYVFYHAPGAIPGTSIAYWGPQVKVGVPQPALNVNMDASTNVDSLSFDFDTESRTLPGIYILNEQTKTTIPVPLPDFSPLNPPLGVVAPIPHAVRYLDDTAKLSPVRAVLRGLAEAAKSTDAVKANGTLDVLRYGRVLQARSLVGLRGAGIAFDGLYFVSSVSSSIKRGEYKQSFSLTRNGLISTVPVVPA